MQLQRAYQGRQLKSEPSEILKSPFGLRMPKFLRANLLLCCQEAAVRQALGFILSVTSLASQAGAQTSQCMAVGDNMVHCNNSGGGWTDCTAIGNMATCNTSGGYRQPSADGGTSLGKGIGSLISRIGENSFRKKVGKMLAAGDCQGAANYALQKGRLELGNSILQSCNTYARPSVSTNMPAAGLMVPRQPSLGSTATPDLPRRLSQTAAAIGRNTTLGDGLLISQAETDENTLVLKSHIKIVPSTLIEQRVKVCDIPAFTRLLVDGAHIKIIYVGNKGHISKIQQIDRTDCNI